MSEEDRETFAALYKKYPDYFPKRMHHWYEISPGWISIIEAACGEVQKYIASLPKKDRVNFYFTQIKEKFGTLRLYPYQCDEEIYRILEAHEVISQRTCEICGAPGKLDRVGWMKVRCKKCQKNFQGSQK